MKTALPLAFLLVGAGIPMSAKAQSDEDIRSSSEIEKIIVTVRRVEENIQVTPVAVIALDNKMLEDAAVTDLTDLTRIVPSMRYQGSGNIANSDIMIRGINRVATGSGGLSAITYFADVPLFGASYLPTFDLTNLQVLRGPQGTLFGVNTVAGAVLVNPTPPGFSPQGYLKGTIGNEEYYQLEGATDIPLIEDKVALRLATQIRRRDGYVENIGPGPDHNDIHQDAYRASLLFEPIDTLSNTLVLDYIKNDEAGWATIAYEANPISPVIPPFLVPAVMASVNEALRLGPYKTNDTLPDPFYKRKSWGAFNTTEWELGKNIALKNVMSFRDASQSFVINTDGIGLNIFQNGNIQESTVVTEEIQLSGDAWDDRVSYIFGAFYSELEYDKLGGLNPLNGAQISNDTYENTSTALFANIKTQLTDKLSFSAGYRYSWDKQDRCFGSVLQGDSRSDCEKYAASTASSNTDGLGLAKLKSTEPTWLLSLEYQASDDVFYYAATRKSFRFGGIGGNYEHPCLSGGAAPPCAINVGGGRAVDLTSFESLENEYIKDIEIGMRSDWSLMGWSQRLNLTAFHYTYENLVATVPVFGLVDPTIPGAPFASTVGFNSGEVEADGLEMELILNPTDDLTFLFSGAYTTQKQTEDAQAPAGFPASTTAAVLAAPKFSGTAAVRYVAPFRPLGGELAFNFDAFYTDDWETSGGSVDGYSLSNMRIDLTKIADSGVDVGFWVRNVFDKEYLASSSFAGSTPFPTKSGNFGDPRMFGLDLTYRWGD